MDHMIEVLNPAASASWIWKAASQVGVSFKTFVLWLWDNPDAAKTFITDCKAGNVGQAVNDVVAAWNASQTPTPSASAS